MQKQEAIDALECYRRNTAHILGDNDEKVKTIDTCIMLVQEAEETEKWIPVSERLPDIHDEVLVTARGEVSIAWLYVDGKWRSNDMPQPMFKDITAWMPLPEPYKEGKA